MKVKKYIAGNVAPQWLSLAANIAMMTALTSLLASLFAKTADRGSMILTAGKNIRKAPAPWIKNR